MNEVLRIALLKIALQRAFLGRAILSVVEWTLMMKRPLRNVFTMPSPL